MFRTRKKTILQNIDIAAIKKYKSKYAYGMSSTGAQKYC